MPVRRRSRDLDEDEEIRPVVTREGRSRRRDEDEDDEPRPRARARSRDEDDEDLEEAPRSRRRSREEEPEEEEAPRRSRSRSRDEDDEDEAPAPRRRSRAAAEDDGFEEEDEDEEAPRSSSVAAGWGAAKALATEGGDYANEFKLSEDDTLIKFLEDAPFFSFRQHFLREKEGKKSFVCLGRGCPLCEDLGHSPDKKFAFNVVDLSETTPQVQMLLAGPRLLGVIEKAHGGKYGPIDKPFWAISRAGKGTKTSYTLNVVKERDLADDWDLDPEEAAGLLKGLEPYDASIVKTQTKGELRTVVDELDD